MSLHSKMTAIADAIRHKTGATETLTLDQMAAEIAEISVGSDTFPFRIVSGTVQPAAPAPNTIWIDTDIPIPEWVVGESTPNDADERALGSLWIEIGTRSVANISIQQETQKLFIPMKAAYMKKYIETMDGTRLRYTYVPAQLTNDGSTWHELWRGQLYAEGNEWPLITGGWKTTAVQSIKGSTASAGAPTITRGSTSITASQITGKSGVFHTTDLIDLTDVNTITFYGSFTRGATAPLNCMIGVWTNFGDYYSETAICSTRMDEVNATDLSMDVSDLVGSYYVGVGLSAASKAVLTSIILE